MNKLRYLSLSRMSSLVIAGILFMCAVWQQSSNASGELRGCLWNTATKLNSVSAC